MYIQCLYIVNTYVLGTLFAIAHNVPHVYDVAPSPTRSMGHVAQRRAAEPEAPEYIRAVMRSCAVFFDLFYSAKVYERSDNRDLSNQS